MYTARMITCHRQHLADRCKERGYALAEVLGCVVSRDGDMWTIDPNHPDYPRAKKPTGKPGTELAAILKSMGLAPVESCKCKGRAKKMDLWGPDGCEQHMDEILGWLAEEAAKRNLPFVKWPAKKVVELAISRARKAQNDG